MNNRFSNWRNSIFIRLLITFITIMALIYLLGIGIYDSCLEALRTRISDQMEADASFYLGNLDSEVERIQRSITECVLDNDLQELAYSADVTIDFEKVQAINRIQQHLYYILNSSNYIDNIYIYVPLLDKTINAKTAPDSFDHTEFEKFMNMKDFFSVYQDGKDDYLCMQSQLKLSSNGEPSYLIAVRLSHAKLVKSLSQFNVNKTGELMLKTQAGKYDYICVPDSVISKQVEEAVAHNLDKSARGSLFYKIGKEPYFIIYNTSVNSNITLLNYLPEYKVFNQLKIYNFLLWGYCLAAVIIIFLYAFYTYRVLKVPLDKLVKSFRKVEKDDLKVFIEHEHNDEFSYIYKRFNAMLQSINNLIDQVYKQKLYAQRAELKQLQSQIDPHFFYNCFFILHRMIKGGENENSLLLSKQLGSYFKFITKSDVDEVTLSDEMEHARIYSDIQAMRFSNRIKVKFGELPEQYRSYAVPRLIMQPLIENAFEHGLKTKLADGLLVISFMPSEGQFLIFIEDNGTDMDDASIEIMKDNLDGGYEDIYGTAIKNIHKRLQLKFGGTSGLSFSRSEFGGLKVTMAISFNYTARQGGCKNVPIIDCR